jgi:hypothetical protein
MDYGAVLPDAFAWLTTPLSGAPHHQIPGWMAWHARAMVMAWGILVPLGCLVARYYKVLPRQDWPNALDNKLWWHGHRVLQTLAIAMMTVGLYLALAGATGNPGAFGTAHGQGAAVHRWLGWGVVSVAWLQLVGGMSRGSKGGPTDASPRGDHFDMTHRRVVFEWAHKTMGWVAVLASIPTILLGLAVADAPRWMPMALAAWWLGIFACMVRLQRQGRCIDTYQAIWGPDESLPGNRRPPIGWGIHRYRAQEWRNTFRGS